MAEPTSSAATTTPDTTSATLDLTGSPAVDVTEPGLHQVERRRSELKAAMKALEGALAAIGEEIEPAQWLGGVRNAVGRLTTAFEQHVHLHEGPESFHAEVLRSQPHLASRISRLQRDHTKLQASLEHLVDVVESASTQATDEIVLRAKDVLHQLDAHRRRGAALVWEAFNYDLGGEH